MRVEGARFHTHAESHTHKLAGTLPESPPQLPGRTAAVTLLRVSHGGGGAAGKEEWGERKKNIESRGEQEI